jgi:indole-3-glycerol phosphate synthase
LDEIVESKYREVASIQSARPLANVRQAALDAPPPRDLYKALTSTSSLGVHLIAEIKRRSPSAGLIRPDFDPATIARIYHASGASALSVLTDGPYFDGRIEYLQQTRAAVPLPILRKDFMIGLYQIYESRAVGTDAILLIGEILEPPLLADMLDLAFGLGMTSLIEVHSRETLDRVHETVQFPNNKRCLLGINNRDLKIQKTDLATTERLAGDIPKGTIIISESGIKTHADVQRLIRAGVHGLLIGETLMRAPDIALAIRELFG